jgi:hypothetical protein
MNSPEPTYRNAEPVRVGDIVQYCESEYVVETVMTKTNPEWSDYWQQQGEGVMLVGPAIGRVYANFDDDELIFVQRGKLRPKVNQ